MKIFKLGGEEDYELAHPVSDDDFVLLDSLIDGTPRGNSWTPIAMKLISKERRRSRTWRRADAPWLGSNILVLRREAANALAPLLVKYGELLPLGCEQAELLAFNAFCVIDALDENASSVERFADGRIMMILKYVFRRETTQGLQIFKLTALQPSPIFVGEEFVERWHATGLKGLDFQQVWEG